MQIKKMRTAVVGCGVISDVYMEALSSGFKIIELAACADLNEERMKHQAEKFGVKPMAFQEILNDPSIELIVNLTNPAAHFDLSRQALEHGKHVFSEKMMAVKLEEGKELVRLAGQKQLRLGVAPDTFLGGSVQTARYIVDKGLIGEPLSAVVSLNRDFDIFGDIFPHMHKAGGSIAFDCECYYMTALASILGPVDSVSSFSRKYHPDRVSKRVDRPWFGEAVHVEESNVITASLKYKNGVLATVHFNGESILNERPCLEIYGTDGILVMGDPNRFDSPVYLKKAMGDMIQFPFTHGYTKNSRGAGVAEMAWSIQMNRPHRASMEMAYHVLELLHGMMISADTSRIYHMQSEFTVPPALPEGYRDNGFWGPNQESAFV